MERLGIKPEQCMMIGNRPNTDIAGAAAFGTQTALVRTGSFLPGASLPANLPAPVWDVERLDLLLRELL